MSTAQHTPGPWEIARLQVIRAPRAVCADGTQGVEVAEVYGDIRQHPQDMANARLIAAAPDLLQSLRNIVTMFESDIKRGAPAQLEAARAALAKADPTEKNDGR